MARKNDAALTIVMPVFNAENTLLRAIESVDRLVRLRSDVELVAVNDASVDGSRVLLEELAAERRYFSVIHNVKNVGPGAARQKGIRQSKAKLIGFLDADDELIAANYSDALEECLVARHDLVTFDALVDYGSGHQSRYDKDRLTSDKQKLLKLCLRGELDGCVMFSIFSRKMLVEANIQFGKYYFEDVEFIYKALLSAKNMLISPKTCYKKHDTAGSILNSCSEFHIKGLIESAISVRDFVAANFEADENEIDRDFRYCLADYVCCLLDAINKHKEVSERLFLRHLLKEKIQSSGVVDADPFELTVKGEKANNFLSEIGC